MSTLPLQLRLTCYYVAMTSVVLAICATTVYVLIDKHLQARTDADLLEELTELSLEVELAPAEDQLRDDLEQRFAHHGDYRMRVDAQAGWTFEGGADATWAAWPSREQLDKSPQWQNVETPDGVRWRVVGARVEGPTGAYMVQAAASTAPDQATIHSLAFAFLITAPCALLLTSVLGYFAARQALAPIREIAATTERISGSSLSERIAEPVHLDDLGRLVRTVNAMLGRLESALEQMRRFTADAAHELRTPLSVVTNEIEVLLRTARTSAEYERSAKQVLAEVHRLTQIVSQLLALSRLDAGITTDEFDHVRLDALLADVVDQCRSDAERAEIAVEMACAGRLCVLGDDIQLSRLFFNLVDNAVRSCLPGGGVKIGCRAADEGVEVTIADNGAGISPDELPRVFERFFRGAGGKAYTGSGLGLSICESIATAHKGRISLASEVGRGTTVNVWLPASTGDDEVLGMSDDLS